MTTFANSGSVQPVGAVEVAVASISGGPFVAVDAYVSGGTPGVQLQFKMYATVGGLRTAIASAIYAGPGVIGNSVLEWTVIDQPEASAPVVAGASQYDLVVVATSPIGVAGGPILATLAGTNAFDADVLASSSPGTAITNVGCAQLADVGATLSGPCDVDLFVSCGVGSVEALVQSIRIDSADGSTAVMRQVRLPVGTQYRAAVRNGSLSALSLATYQGGGGGGGGGGTNPNPFGPGPNALLTTSIGFLSTPDATPSSAFLVAPGVPLQFTVPDDTAIDVVVTVIGRNGADVFCQDYRARYERNGGGAVNLLGVGVIVGANPLATGAIAAAVATLVIVGQAIKVQVTGVAATVIHWSALMEVQQVQ